MKLMTKALEERFAKVGCQEKVEDPIIIAKFFHPFSSWYWFATEFDAENRIFFGLVKGDETEWGDFSLDELESVKIHGLGIERDLHFGEKPLSEVKKEYKIKDYRDK
jgi:hypothetical protein